MNVIALTVTLVGVCLIALITFELTPQTASEGANVSLMSQVPVIASPTLRQSNEAETAALVETLLTRPLFSQTRHSPVIASSASTTLPTPPPLPRLTGILIDGPRRLAIFAAQTGLSGSKPTTITEGGLIGPFTIRTIGRQQVIVTGPDGERTVHIGFDPDLQPPSPSVPTPVSYNLDAPKILNIAPGPSLLNRSLQPGTAFRPRQATGPIQ